MSSFSEACNNTPRYLTCSKIVPLLPFKETTGVLGCGFFRGGDSTLLLLSNSFVFSSTVTTDIQDVFNATGAGTKHTYVCHYKQ